MGWLLLFPPGPPTTAPEYRRGFIPNTGVSSLIRCEVADPDQRTHPSSANSRPAAPDGSGDSPAGRGGYWGSTDSRTGVVLPESLEN